MAGRVNWQDVWERRSSGNLSDFELDRGRSPADENIEKLSGENLIDFIAPREWETVLDAGCGTGTNLMRLHSQVKNIIGIDYAQGSLDRCRRALQARNITNARMCRASVTSIPLPGNCTHKVISLSVLQYLSDEEVRQAFTEFVRVLVPGGMIVLHVKNLSSLYWSTLWFAKKVKALIGGRVQIEHMRPFKWYAKELETLGCEIVGYDSFNFLMLDFMPERVASLVRKFELRYHNSLPFGHPFMRRYGAELMIKARVAGLLTSR